MKKLIFCVSGRNKALFISYYFFASSAQVLGETSVHVCLFKMKKEVLYKSVLTAPFIHRNPPALVMGFAMHAAC